MSAHRYANTFAPLQPTSTTSLTELRDEGILRFKNNELMAAKIALTQYVKQVDNDSLALTYLGLSQCDIDDYIEGMRSISRAIKADPNSAKAYMVKASRLLPEQIRERYQAATQALALLTKPKTAEDYWYRARAKYFIDELTVSNPKDWHKRGDDDRRKFIELTTCPSTHLDYWRLGTAYQALGEQRQCITAFTRALKISQEDYTYDSLQQAQAAIGDRQGALSSISAAIFLNPQVQYFITRGNLYMQLKLYKKAVGDFDTAESITQSDLQRYEIHKDRAAARFCLGDYAGAMSDFSASRLESLKLTTQKALEEIFADKQA